MKKTVFIIFSIIALSGFGQAAYFRWLKEKAQGEERALAENCRKAEIPEKDVVRAEVDLSGKKVELLWYDPVLAKEVAFELPYDPEGDFKECSDSAKKILKKVQEKKNLEKVKQSYIVAREPDAKTPASESCGFAEVGDFADITVGQSVSEPRCMKVFPDQILRIKNSTDEKIDFKLGNYRLTINPNRSEMIDYPFRYYLKPGVHRVRLNSSDSLGPEIWVLDMQEIKEVRLYYYNPEKDKNENGNIMCSRQGLTAVKRQIVSEDPILDAIKLLLQGRIQEHEKELGITSEFPIEGLEAAELAFKDNELTLTFRDPENKTVGGACRVGVLWFQIVATAKQFPEVQKVKFFPEDLFQP